MENTDLNTPHTIYSQNGLEIHVSNTLSKEVLGLLSNTIYGTSGPKYRHTNQADRTTNLSNPYFFLLQFEGKLIGIYCLTKRLSQGKSAYYGRYFTILPNYQAKGFGLILKTEAVKYIETIEDSKPNFYSYIEENNQKSLLVSEKLGFIKSGILKTILFTRFNPKSSLYFYKTSPAELIEVKDILSEKYQNYLFNNLEKIGYNGNYFVLKKNGAIVAGIQANPVSWIIEAMDGLTGFFLLNILPKLPILKKVFKPSKFEFLAIEGVFGEIDDIYELIEATLFHFSLHTAMLQLDIKDPYYTDFKSKGNLGLLQLLKKPTQTFVVTKYNSNQSPKQPIYVSSFDYT